MDVFEIAQVASWIEKKYIYAVLGDWEYFISGCFF